MDYMCARARSDGYVTARARRCAYNACLTFFEMPCALVLTGRFRSEHSAPSRLGQHVWTRAPLAQIKHIDVMSRRRRRDHDDLMLCEFRYAISSSCARFQGSLMVTQPRIVQLWHIYIYIHAFDALLLFAQLISINFVIHLLGGYVECGWRWILCNIETICHRSIWFLLCHYPNTNC